MGNRLSKIYTRTGDDGTTALASGKRVKKFNEEIEVIGQVDELNSLLGILVDELKESALTVELYQIQNQLFEIGGELAMPQYISIQTQHIKQLETLLDRYNDDLPALKEFILPGGGKAAGVCHLSRSVCRRVERRLVALAEMQPIRPALLSYINRLSDLLFVFARVITRQQGEPEKLWCRTTD